MKVDPSETGTRWSTECTKVALQSNHYAKCPGKGARRRLEEVRGEKAWRPKTVTEDFLEEEAFSWALKDENGLEVHFPCVRMDAEKNSTEETNGVHV